MSNISNKERKRQQRQAHKAQFMKARFNHGTRAIRKKEEAALGK
jgi:hypothetical protein